MRHHQQPPSHARRPGAMVGGGSYANRLDARSSGAGISGACRTRQPACPSRRPNRAAHAPMSCGPTTQTRLPSRCSTIGARCMCTGIPPLGPPVLPQAGLERLLLLVMRAGHVADPPQCGLDPRPLVTTYELHNREQAFADVERRTVVKAVILPS
jgi:hypothetical protein